MRRLAAVSVLMAWLIAGCSLFADAPTAPQPCGQVYSAQRCLAMTDAAAAEISATRADVVAVAIVPDPPPADGVLQTLGGATPIKVRITLANGTVHTAMMCGGLAMAPACQDDPVLQVRSVVGPNGGYRDVPCSGEPPDGCATPHPSLEPSAVADANPLMIDQLNIPIAHRGVFEVPLGKATLANGILTEASVSFVDDWPADVAIAGGAVSVDVRSLEPGGRPFHNYYEHGWRPGVERVEVVLVFEVLWSAPGAVLAIRDAAVR